MTTDFEEVRRSVDRAASQGTRPRIADGAITRRQLRERGADREPLVFTSGTVPTTAEGDIPKGKVGADVTTEEAVQHARSVGLNLLAIFKQELGDLDRARRVVKLLGMVNAVPDYLEQSKVINGCSDLFAEVFGQQHARSAVGVGSLPFGITVEIEAIFEVE